MIIRVFPRPTNATPTDAMAFVGEPPLFRPEADEVHVSVTFTWDLAEGERLRRAWERYYPGRVRIGGPAFHGPKNRPGEFVPGRYLQPGYTITSRGCPNACSFCSVPEREGALCELPIRDGWNVLDNNLLACSPEHVAAVFAMLHRQRRRIEFTGGLDARRVTPAIADQLLALRLERLFLAYDSPDAWDDTRAAITLLREAGLTRDHVHCYVLAAYGDDSPDRAAARCEQVLEAGGIPFLMLYHAPEQEVMTATELRESSPDWWAVRQRYIRPARMMPAGRRAVLEAKWKRRAVMKVR